MEEKFDPNFLWGEIPDAQEDEKVSKEIAELIILSAIKMEKPKTKHPQPPPGAGNDIIIGPEHSTMEENVLYTIKLIQHARQVKKLIEEVTSSNSSDKGTSGEFKPCPPMPFKSESIQANQNKLRGGFPQQESERKDTPFTLGEPLHLPDIGKVITKEILFKFVGTVVAHAGFDTAMQIPLQTLADVTENYLKRFTTLLRFATDREDLYGNTGFPDAMERVYNEMGIGSITTMHDFYQKRIFEYRDMREARSLSLVQKYQAILQKRKSETEDARFKNEMEIEEEIPELHFPASAEGGCEDELQSSLEPGFQMLQSLEQEVGIKYGKE